MITDTSKFILTADLHLGLRQYGSSKREEHFYNAVRQIVQYAITNKISVICVAGDALDSIYPKQNTMQFAKDMHQLLIKHKITMYISSGNHDNTEHSWFDLVTDKSISYGIVPADDKLLEAENGLKIYGIKSYAKDKIIAALNTKEALNADIILIHTNCKEFVTYNASATGNSSTKLFSVQDFPFEVFKDKPHVYVCIGDTHITKRIDLHNVTFVSPGSTEVTKSNEDLDKYIFTYDSNELQQVSLPAEYIRLRTDGVIKTSKDLDAFIKCIEEIDNKVLKEVGGVMYIYYDPTIKDEVISRLNAFFYPYSKVIRKYIPKPEKNYVLKKDIVLQDEEHTETIMTLTEFMHVQAAKYNLSIEGSVLLETLITNSIDSTEEALNKYMKTKQIKIN
jgi:DNA repair exonuclease SbcCD nuclease subunit